jgi:chemotaxis signal transduction protein
MAPHYPAEEDAMAELFGTRAETPGARDLLFSPAPSAGTVATMERLLTHAAGASALEPEHSGVEYLLFTCGQVRCAAALHQLREVLPALPVAVALPFSHAWLLGVFPLRTELLALVDPRYILLGPDGSLDNAAAAPSTTALIVGEGDASLGLAVTTDRDIGVERPDEVVPAPAHDGSSPQIMAPYATGRYVRGGGEPHAVIDMPRLVTDLLVALTEGATDG